MVFYYIITPAIYSTVLNTTSKQTFLFQGVSFLDHPFHFLCAHWNSRCLEIPSPSSCFSSFNDHCNVCFEKVFSGQSKVHFLSFAEFLLSKTYCIISYSLFLHISFTVTFLLFLKIIPKILLQ